MATLSRAATDGIINGWKNSFKTDQTNWRGQGKRQNYGQVLLGGGKPNDQPLAGPALPNNPNVVCWIDVYEVPNGYGWKASFIANDSGSDWIKTISCHEDGPLVEADWIAYP